MAPSEPPTLARYRNLHGLGGRVSGHADSIYGAAWMLGPGLGIGLLPVPAIAASPQFQLWPLLPAGTERGLDVLVIRRRELGDRAACALLDMIKQQIAWHAATS